MLIKMNYILTCLIFIFQGANFGNPVYESMYNAGGIASSEEKKGLLRDDLVLEKNHTLTGSQENL